MKPTFKKGAEARKNFEEGMKKLFRVPKSSVSATPKNPRRKIARSDAYPTTLPPEVRVSPLRDP